MSDWRRHHDVEHVVLERGNLAQRWRDERWDSLTLLTPNWATQLPGFPYDGPDPDGFEGRDAYISYLERYAAAINAPLQTKTEVLSLERADSRGRYLLRTSHGPVETNNVVVATGPFHEPSYPDTHAAVPLDAFQLHSSSYRNPSQLPDGAVLVVGGGNSGLQIAEDLINAGRRVFLSVGRLRAAPRRYRGKDLIWWLIQQGALDRKVEDLPSPEAKNVVPPLLTGVLPVHDLSPSRLIERGATLLGRLLGGGGGRLEFSEDIRQTLATSDEAYQGFKASIDQYILANGLDSPQDLDSVPTPPLFGDPTTRLDLRREDVHSVIWATGFRYAYDWVKLPVFDSDGDPVHRGGVTRSEGLYFIGLRWLRKYKSFFIYGVGEDAEHIARHVASRGEV
jgi:putative flavoprotein involved in K+ transport